MNLQPEISAPTLECLEPRLWRCYDGFTAELEVLEFMAQLVLAVKPRLIVETGTYHGLAAFYLGRALAENGRGRLVTYEVVDEFHARSRSLIERGGLERIVECRLQSSLESADSETIDILFTDSQESIRAREIEHFWPRLSPASLVVVHDVNSGAHRGLRRQVLDFDTEGRLSVVFFPTPRGLALCQKREGRH